VRAVRAVRASNAGGALVELVSGETIACDAVVVATPAPVAARLLAATDTALAAELSTIEHGSLATIALGYPPGAVTRPLDATGYVVPRTEGRPVLACTWVSSKHAGRAPEGAALFRVFVGGAHRPEAVDWSDDALTALAREELLRSIDLSAEPCLVHITRWRNAMPQYVLGHPERVARIEAREAALPWLALAGNSYRGVGVPDCVASGDRAAARLLAQLADAAADDTRSSVLSAAS
jgi:oxygen-dependent protoporphyrinogen oxidase